MLNTLRRISCVRYGPVSGLRFLDRIPASPCLVQLPAFLFPRLSRTEQRTSNPQVVGSSPTGDATFSITATH